jgi:hypothetical protein
MDEQEEIKKQTEEIVNAYLEKRKKPAMIAYGILFVAIYIFWIYINSDTSYSSSSSPSSSSTPSSSYSGTSSSTSSYSDTSSNPNEYAPGVNVIATPVVMGDKLVIRTRVSNHNAYPINKKIRIVVGSKVAHAILPELCPVIDVKHTAISLFNVAPGEYLPPGDSWDEYLGYTPRGKVNPSPRGCSRNRWRKDQFLCAIGFYARIYHEWQEANGNPGMTAFLSLEPVQGTTGIPRFLDKVFW